MLDFGVSLSQITPGETVGGAKVETWSKKLLPTDEG